MFIARTAIHFVIIALASHKISILIITERQLRNAEVELAKPPLDAHNKSICSLFAAQLTQLSGT